MTRKSFATRLADLEALEARRAAEAPAAELSDRIARRRATLAALGFTSGDSTLHCECCRWTVPHVCRLREQGEQPDGCLICGACIFGPTMPRVYDYYPEARYRCPRCTHRYSGARHTLTPCPACGFVPPPPPDGDGDDDRERYVGALAAALARLHGAPVALAWLDIPDAAADLALLDRWWFEEAPRALLTGARDFLAGDGYRVAHSLRDGVVAWFTLSPSPYSATWEPQEWADARWLARLLEGLCRAQGAGLPASRDDARALLDTLTIRDPSPAAVVGA